MRFTLHYRGPLKANGGPKDKQRLRRHFHKQLKAYWTHLPLADHEKKLNPNQAEGDISVIETIEAFQFAPLVCERLHMLAELDIILLRPGPPGALVSGGDIDNRLKTLLDALKVPREPTALPPGDKPAEGETPLFCLLGDDRLITRLNVDTASLLEPTADPADVELLLRVTTHATRAIYGNIGLG